ncbi:VOC family protein [Phenylobacterium sp.]|jgi:predicted lactoylglutathione lyase|uniref:VOC family protein n=1 Tax=Phenylobacterium sp. TaxID=1871053 RepID=UPI003783624F
MQRMIFVNLPVKDLEASRRFFGALGFTFNPKFCSDDALCCVIEENIIAMLLLESRFKDFIKGDIADTAKGKEALICLSAANREEVDGFLAKALANGGQAWMPAQDYGFMYGVSFLDPDGHVWEVMWMDPAAAEKGPEAYVAEMA